MKIFHNDTLVLDVEVDDNSYRYRAIKGDHALTLYFSLDQHVEIPVGATCEFQGETYTLEKPESLKMEHTRQFEYTVVFDSSQAKATKFKFRNHVDRRLKFSLTAKPIEHLRMFVDNMNQRDSGWTVGQCIDALEKLVSYNHSSCFEALGMMADTFETEWEIVGKQVSLWKIEYNRENPLPLSYGRGKGLMPGLGRTNFEDSVPVEVLYVQGGDRNIDASKYGNGELLLPKSQTIRFDGVHFEDEGGFDASKARAYITDADGFSLRRADKPLSSMVEDSLDCSDIYPSRVGTISSVVVVDAEKNLYDIVDKGIPSSLNFEDYIISGETMTIIPQSGMLAGRELEVKYVHNAIIDAVNNKAARRFEIVPQEMDGQTMPGGVFIPKVGDTYAVFHCMLPASYICDNTTKSGASWDMFRQGVKHLYDNEGQKFSHDAKLNGGWAKKDWLNIGGRIKLGDFILFSEPSFQPEEVAIRIIGIKDFINDPHSPEIEISNSTVGRSVAGALKKLENNEILVDKARKDAVSYTKRRFRDAEEHLGLIEKAVQGYDKGINPSWIHTLAALFGDETLQFVFVDDKTTPEAVDSGIRYDNAAKRLIAPAGIIQHKTIGITTLSPIHDASEYTFWDLPAFESPVLDTPEPMYVYAKCRKANSTGAFYMSAMPMDFDNADGNYYLLIGTLSSEFEGYRSYVESYGFTEILPGRITLWKIVDPDGFQFWDMLNKAFRIGNAETYLDYNSRGDKKLRLKGTIFQSDSGDESFPGVFRGEYGSSITYHPGDEVTYTVNGSTPRSHGRTTSEWRVRNPWQIRILRRMTRSRKKPLLIFEIRPLPDSQLSTLHAPLPT